MQHVHAGRPDISGPHHRPPHLRVSTRRHEGRRRQPTWSMAGGAVAGDTMQFSKILHTNPGQQNGRPSGRPSEPQIVDLSHPTTPVRSATYPFDCLLSQTS